MINLEQNVREICKRKGLRLSDIAERVGTGQSNLIYSLKGNPTISTIENVASALQVSVNELLTLRPDSALGIAIIDVQSYQLTQLSRSTVKIPSYTRYDILRRDIKSFIKGCINESITSSIMGIVETLELFSLVYESETKKFILSLCYANGQITTRIYDNLEYCCWPNESSVEASWDINEITTIILNDIEGLVPLKLMAK